ncbi:D-Ala-D-Ala carboxypeptidase family metallohydrolase [Acetobacterium woodii]|uniref:Peptidase M15A C-terminal domain-containing protein n=1 Tax=Acetobacterium woodii (strain ATCC 29683 / DSM 1030 / JCM 2381 / KCTC 1655 / WB1) TaxID=931626 RepID=H6LIS6_ACEWD|nr:D-Ala-D-Ala carboxypeptidase family metallohydrolase [Acetobacterium woodii]AFA49815.1 hypothetical protein Awo_c30870 [Acetobacterium woodii DSM 1030]
MSNKLFDVNTIYAPHVQNDGWGPEVRNGVDAGTTGQNKRLEAFTCKLELPEGVDLHVMCRAHVKNKGWLDPVYDGEICGTVGEGLSLQAIQLQLSGADSDKYEIWIQVHVQNRGWMNWMSGGELAGTVGFDLQAEAIRIMVFAKGVSLKTDGVVGFVEYVAPPAADPVVNKNMAGKYFSWKELSCDCPPWKYGFGWCDGYPEQDLKNQNAPYLIDILDKVREYFGSQVIVTSMIRCQDCNDHWGGIPGSYHTTWQAVDIVVPGHSAYEVAVVANNLTGCGARYYEIDQFTHLEPPGCGVYCQQAA